jgi:endonuclease/exonuclease/phosphatase family metal-dependent hydrolase
VIIFNTHLDHHCPLPMVELCREKMAAFTRRGIPLIFMGDFNVTPTHDAYALLTGDGWHDAHGVSSGPSEATHMQGRRIDHIFYRGAGVTPQTWIQLFSPDPQRPLSDHYPVYVRLRTDARGGYEAISREHQPTVSQGAVEAAQQGSGADGPIASAPASL